MISKDHSQIKMGAQEQEKKEAAELKKASVHKDWLRDEAISKSWDHLVSFWRCSLQHIKNVMLLQIF